MMGRDPDACPDCLKSGAGTEWNMASRLPQRRVVFAWDLHYSCNYRCPYCWYTVTGWDNLALRNRYRSPQEWAQVWGRIYLKCGRCQIRITAGEPLTYPGFVDVVSGINRCHDLQITTNASMTQVLRRFVHEIGPETVEFDCTFHPLEADFDSFAGNVLLLRRHGFTANVCYLAYPHPRQMPPMGEFKKRFAERGIYMNMAIFWGEYKGRRFPLQYTQEEKQWIRDVIGREMGPEHVNLDPIPVTGKVCGAGQRYAVVQTDGRVFRCGQLCHEDQSIGNIFDPDFALSPTGKPCPSDYCRSKEFQSAWEEEKKRAFMKDLRLTIED